MVAWVSSAGRSGELIAPTSWRTIDFISDLHLASDTPRTFEVWATYLRDTCADAVLILGDLFEVWIGDDARFESFEARAAAVLSEAAARRDVGFMAGNRDFLLGPALLEDCGIERLEDPTVLVAFGQRVLLSHGDAMCLGDRAYQQFREVVRAERWQREFLARPLAERRALATAMRGESERLKADGGPWHDVDRTAATDALRDADAALLIHGHTHRPDSESFGGGQRREVLSDWDFEDASTTRADVLRWQPAGFSRIAPADAAHCQT